MIRNLLGHTNDTQVECLESLVVPDINPSYDCLGKIGLDGFGDIGVGPEQDDKPKPLSRDIASHDYTGADSPYGD